MTRSEIKEDAQTELLVSMEYAFSPSEHADISQEVMEEMKVQFRRVEKFFGFETKEV